MTKEEEQIREGLKAIYRAPIQCEIATITDVNEEELNCVVVLADGTEIPDVRLKASIENVTDGFVQIPELKSSVIVGLIGNDTGTRFVLLFSKVTKVVFYGGSNGPLVIWENKLKAELDKVKDLLTALVSVLNGAPVPEPGNGAMSALQTALKTATEGKLLPSFEDLTDDKVIH